MINRRGAIAAGVGAALGVNKVPEALRDMGAKAETSAGYGSAVFAKTPDEKAWRANRMAELRRWASGDVSDDEICKSTLMGGGVDSDGDLACLKSMSTNARRVFMRDRALRRAREHFIANAIRQLKEQFEIAI